MKKIYSFIIAAMMMVMASAAQAVPASVLLDFTREDAKDVLSGSYSDTTYTLTSNPSNSLNWNQLQDGSTCDSGALACHFDGIGIADDEISEGGTESMTISFGGQVSIDGLFFLDLFRRVGDPTDREIVKVDFQGGSKFIQADTAEIVGSGTSGYLFFALAPGEITTNFLTFTAPTGMGKDDRNNDYAVAAISGVSVVPLPAALPLYGTGLAVMGLLGWRKKQRKNR